MTKKKTSSLIALMLICMVTLNGCVSSKEQVTEITSEQTSEVSATTAAELSEEEEWIASIAKAEYEILLAPGTEEYLSDEEISERFAQITQDVKDGKIDKEICYHRIQSIMSELHCSHLQIYTNYGNNLYNEYIDLYLRWFGDELIITSSFSEENKEYLGCRITKISGYSVDEAVDKLATLGSFETDSGKKQVLESLVWKTDLSYVGMLNENGDGVDITVEDQNGNEVNFVSKFVNADAQNTTFKLSDSFESEDQFPISYRNYYKDLYYCYEADKENKTMYFQYNVCDNMQDYSLEQCFDDMMNEISADTFDNMVIDVRWNSGGNRYIMVNALNKYKDELNKMNIYIITGKYTYSSGFQLISDCMERFENVTLYGEKTGQAVHHYTEIKQVFLKGMNCWMTLPTAKNNDPILEEKYGDIKDGIIPDVIVYQTFDDYMNGKDTIYDKIVRDTQRNKEQ